jgi:hypothetical protein
MLALALGASSLLAAHAAVGSAAWLPPPASRASVVLHVDPGTVDASTLALAETTIRALLEDAAVGLEWQIDATGGCGESGPAARAVKVVLIPSVSPRSPHVGGEVARDAVSGRRVVLVYVTSLVNRLSDLRAAGGGRSADALATLQPGELIGLVVAHELGHVLGLRHAKSGVMKPGIEADDLRRLRAGRLAFSARDATSLRQALPRPSHVAVRTWP